MPEHLPVLQPLLASMATAMPEAKVQRTHFTWKHTLCCAAWMSDPHKKKLLYYSL